MPENNRTKWVGIRPVNPPEDIPVTLGAEVPHVIVDAGCAGNKSVGSLRTGYLREDPAAIGEWYEVIAVTNKGFVCVVAFYSEVQTMHQCHWRLTIDGDVPQDLDMAVLNSPFSKDISGVHRVSIQIPLDMRYETGFKLEMMDDVGGSDLRGGVFYTIDQ